MDLLQIPEDQRTSFQKEQIEFFRQRGSTFLLCAAIAKCCEIFLGKAIPDQFDLMFPEVISLNEAIQALKPIISISLAFAGYLNESLDSNLKIVNKIKDDIVQFRSFLEATKNANLPIYEKFKNFYGIN